MFEKNLRISYLLDFYGEALDEHTRSVMTAYYEDDLSLGEIATDEGISRQGVRHIIKKGEEQLLFLEERLGLAEQNERLQSVAQLLIKIKEGIKDGSVAQIEGVNEELDRAIGIILNKS